MDFIEHRKDQVPLGNEQKSRKVINLSMPDLFLSLEGLVILT